MCVNYLPILIKVIPLDKICLSGTIKESGEFIFSKFKYMPPLEIIRLESAVKIKIKKLSYYKFRPKNIIHINVNYI